MASSRKICAFQPKITNLWQVKKSQMKIFDQLLTIDAIKVMFFDEFYYIWQHRIPERHSKMLLIGSLHPALPLPQAPACGSSEV
jgi:hypothetical protein